MSLLLLGGADGTLPLIPCCKTLNVNFTFHLFFFPIKI